MLYISLIDSFLTQRFRHIIILTFFLAFTFLPLSVYAADPTYDLCHSSLFGWDENCLMTKTRAYFNITSDQIPNDILLAYIKDNKEKVSTYLMTVDDGNNIASFLHGSALNIYGDTLSAELQIYSAVGSLAWGALTEVMLFPVDSFSVDLLSNLYDAMKGINGGLGALENAIKVLSSKETRFLLGVYCQDRYNGMTPSEAWADITIPEFQPLWNLINNLQTVSPDARNWNFEKAYLSYRQVGYGDSYDLRTNIGDAIVALCYPSIFGQDVVGVLNSLTLSGAGLIGGSNPNSWEWDFNYNGSTFNQMATGQQVSYVFKSWGQKTIALRATASGQPPVIITKSITVRPPQINVSYPNGFDDLLRHFSTPHSDYVTSYAWYYGDNSPPEEGREQGHTYPASGSYTVQLVLTLDDNTTVNVSEPIFVGPGTVIIQGHTIYYEETWHSSETCIEGDITIAKGGKLTIESGAQVELQSGSAFTVYGTLIATGVRFTARDQASPWGGINFFGAGSKDSRLENCVLEYGKGNYNGSVIWVSDTSPTIKGCTIDKSGGSNGIYIQNGSPVIQDNTINGFANGGSGIVVTGTSFPMVTGNTITNNTYGIYVGGGVGGGGGTYQGNTISGNTEYGIYVSYSTNTPVFSGNTYSNNGKGDLTATGQIQGAAYWDDTGVYDISSLGISQGSSLTIVSGRTVTVNGGFSVDGTLTATGVRFTARDQASPWGGINFIGAGSKDSRLENCVLEYGKGNYNGSVIWVSDTSPTIKGCTIDKSSGSYGIYIQDGSPVIQDNTINGFANGGSGIVVTGTSFPMVTGNTITNNTYGIYVGGGGGTYQGNTISGNTSYGLYNSGSTMLDATNCDWGAPSGPLDPSDDRATGGLYNPDGKGNKVSDHVNYYPWKVLLQVPTNVQATDGTYSNKVEVNWTAVTDATGYKVYRSTTNNSVTATLIGSPASFPYNDTNAVFGTTYFYWVKATYGTYDSLFSGSDSGFVGSQTGTVVINPEPAAMNATAPWTLAGPNSYSRTGAGDLTLNNLAAGNYTITWGDVSGWDKPSPASETKTLTSGGTTTFNGPYVHQTIPVIQVTPVSLNFGHVPVGSTKDLFLTVKNTGSGTLTGNATTAAPFSIVSGGSYSLSADQSQVVTIQYQPTSPGTHTGTVVMTGGAGATVPVTGKTEKPLGLPWLMLLLEN